MSRLTTPKTERNREMICRYEDCDVCEEYCPHLNEDNCQCLQEVLSKLADYEDKEEQGLLIELPCKVGDTVYALTPFCEICEEALDNEYACEICSKGNFISETKFDYEMIPMFGKVVFLTEAEAESALAKTGGK